jgi:hypothetical protein
VVICQWSGAYSLPVRVSMSLTQTATRRSPPHDVGDQVNSSGFSSELLSSLELSDCVY